MSSRGQLKGSHPTASHRRAPQVQGVADSPLILKSSLVWAFFDTCAADCTVAVCNLCLKRIKRGQNSTHLGTTCLTRKTCTERNQGIAISATSTCSQSASSTPPSDFSRQISLPQLLNRKKNKKTKIIRSQPSTCSASKC